MQIKLDNNTINIIHKMEARRIFNFLLALMFFLVLIVYGIFRFIDDNQKIYIVCNKKENICTIETKKFFLPVQKRHIIYDKTKEAILHTVGCSRGTCTYNIHIPYYNSYIKIYTQTENKYVANAIVENFNKFRNANVNTFDIDGRDIGLTVGFGTINTFFLIILLLVFLSIIPFKITIRVNSNNKKLTVIKKFLFYTTNKNIDFSKIGTIKIEKAADNWQINYTDLSKRYGTHNIITLLKEEEAKQIYEILTKQHESNK